MSRRVLVVPGVPALLSSYASGIDPVADLRAAVVAGLGWVAEEATELAVVAEAPSELDRRRGVALSVGERIVTGLLGDAGAAGVTCTAGSRLGARSVVVANGSARRSEKAPGHLDERALAFDAAVEEALATGDTESLTRLDLETGDALWCSGLAGLRSLGDERVLSADLHHASDPFGVRYWVARWVVA